MLISGEPSLPFKAQGLHEEHPRHSCGRSCNGALNLLESRVGIVPFWI